MDDDVRSAEATLISRRALLQGSALLGAGAFLAACAPGTSTSTATPRPTSTTPTGPLDFANWDAYIDLTTVPGPDGVLGTDDDDYDLPSPTLDEFSAKYGVEVNYVNAKIDENESFMAGIRPQLQQGVDTQWDLIVLTDWMASKVVAAGWAEKIDHAHTATALANVRDELKGAAWDPNFDYHFPWQQFATGVGYNGASTKRDLTSIADLFDPAFAGKVTLLEDPHDTFPLVHLMLQAQGKASATKAEQMTAQDLQVVHDFLRPYRESGHIRGFKGNAYLQDFGSGDTWAALVWSGDLASSGGPDDHFVYPVEGSMIATDNMIIPKGAQDRFTAELMMDWVYDVDRAARLAAFIYYISPVKGVSEAIKALDPEASSNVLLFPTAEILAKQHPQPTWDEATEKKANELMADLRGL